VRVRKPRSRTRLMTDLSPATRPVAIGVPMTIDQRRRSSRCSPQRWRDPTRTITDTRAFRCAPAAVSVSILTVTVGSAFKRLNSAIARLALTGLPLPDPRPVGATLVDRRETAVAVCSDGRGWAATSLRVRDLSGLGGSSRLPNGRTRRSRNCDRRPGGTSDP